MIYFILGAHPKISIAEIKTVLGNDFVLVEQSPTVLLCKKPPQKLDSLQDKLAGVVKVGHIIGELKEWDETGGAELIASYASSAMGKNKIRYGISVYDLGDKRHTHEIKRESDALGGAIKKILKELGRPVRYVTSKEPALSSVVVETNGLLASGGEYVLLVGRNRILIGQTEAVQNFRAWSDRDYGRPARDARSGMLPPKLARMMINLAGVPIQDHSILDPFCGSGTVLMEAALMGASKLIGNDISKKAVADTQRNLTWLTDQFNLPHLKLELFTAPAAELEKHFSGPVDLIVTEVYLGRPRNEAVDIHEFKKFEKKMLPLYEESLRKLRLILSKDGRVVVAFPALKAKTRPSPAARDGQSGDFHRLPLKTMLEAIGYSVVAQHIYARDNQFVARDIYVLTLK